MKKKQTSIKDIAKAVGVSTSTVSRVLSPNQNATISTKIRNLVLQKAKEMHYVSDINATGLRKRETKTVGMVIPDFLNPFFSSIIKGAQDYLSKKGYVIFVMSSDNDPMLAEAEVKKLIGRRVDGIIFVSAFLEDESVKICIESDIPLVLVNRSINNPNNIHTVLNNDVKGIKLAVNHLYDLGHRSITHLSGPPNISQGKTRCETFIQVCCALSIDYDVIQLKSFTFQEGVIGAKKMTKKKNKATGIIAANDMIAMGAMHYLQKEGYGIPHDYSVVGFNNMPLSEMVHPPLTTVDVPQKTMGKEAAKILLENISNPYLAKKDIILSPMLKLRSSTAMIRIL